VAIKKVVTNLHIFAFQSQEFFMTHILCQRRRGTHISSTSSRFADG